MAHRNPKKSDNEPACSILLPWPAPHTLSTTRNPRDVSGRLSRLMAAS